MLAKSLGLFLLSVCLFFAVSGVANAHTGVSPERASPGDITTFTVSSPAEKSIPIVEVRVEIPDGFEVRGVDSPPGWKGSTEGNSIVWTGGEIPEGKVREFTFEARVPEAPGEYAWRAFDTYKDGSVSEWTGPPDSGNPASIVYIGSEGSGAEGSGGHHGDDSVGLIPDTGGLAPAFFSGIAGLAVLMLGAVGLIALGRV